MVNILSAVRAAIIANSSVTSLLGTYAGQASVHTRRPIPVSATYPMIVINAPYSITDEDALVARRSVIGLDIAIYGLQDTQYRVVDEAAFLLRTQFHRVKAALTVSGHNVYEIVVTGPTPAPVDDDEYVGRLVSLTVKIQPN